MTQVFERPPLSERVWLLRVLRDDTIGGAIMLAAAVLAVVWANSAWGDSYQAFATTEVGPEWLRLDLRAWASDGLLALFFFLAGLELKHELVHGTLSKPSKAVVPFVAALGGMVVPALIYVALSSSDPEAGPGWGIPMATDIAFALAVLAVLGRGLPLALRAFLLTLAVVDDLGAIIVIAIFYSKGFDPTAFIIFVVTAVAWWLLQRQRIGAWLPYVIVFAIGWFYIHESGVHATIAGVVYGMLTRTTADGGETEPPTDRFDRTLRPFVFGIAVPLFALLAAGVDLRSTGLAATLTEPTAIGVMVGLVIGKPIGVVAGAWIVAKFTRASLDPALRWWDVLTIGLLAGIGFTVSLLIAKLAFDGSALSGPAKTGVLAASVVAALLSAVMLYLRRAAYARMNAVEERDENGNLIPDVYETDR